MTTIVERECSNMAKDALQVWHCQTCRCYHMRAGETLIGLTPNEFANFTQDVVNCYCSRITNLIDD